MPSYYYLITKEFLTNYHNNKKKIIEYEDNLNYTYNEYINFLKNNDFCDHEDENIIKFNFLIEHTTFIVKKFKEISIEIGCAFWSKNNHLFSFSKSQEEIKEYFQEGYVIVDEHWSEEFVYLDTYKKFIEFLNIDNIEYV